MRILFLVLILIATGVHAEDGWRPVLNAHFRQPALFLAVDKEKQETYFVRPENGTTEKDAVTCTTGRKDGDKQREGDLKTPEGVYFVGDKIEQKLDYTLYGNTAFALNYPNPMDRLRDKTGYGIWIHGRGTPITPKLTRGCVALQNCCADSLHEHIIRHRTPVLIAQELTWNNSTATPFPDVVRGAWSWIGAKERRDPNFFEFYHPDLYAKSTGKSFAAFTQRIQEEFAAHPWMDIRVEDMHILEGPGYVVSAFVEYNHPFAEKVGHRRLYWTEEDGSWKIAGEEWVELEPLDQKAYAERVNREIRAVLAHGEKLWSDGDNAGLREVYAPQSKIPTDTGNPFSGESVVSITKKGVLAVLTRPGAPATTFLFQPGPFDTWLVVGQNDD
jgi:murein L,D-transpeptidase YafK